MLDSEGMCRETCDTPGFLDAMFSITEKAEIPAYHDVRCGAAAAHKENIDPLITNRRPRVSNGSKSLIRSFDHIR